MPIPITDTGYQPGSANQIPKLLVYGNLNLKEYLDGTDSEILGRTISVVPALTICDVKGHICHDALPYKLTEELMFEYTFNLI